MEKYKDTFTQNLWMPFIYLLFPAFILDSDDLHKMYLLVVYHVNIILANPNVNV